MDAEGLYKRWLSDPFAAVDWRWQLAKTNAKLSRPIDSKRFDKETLTAIGFLRMRSQPGRQRLKMATMKWPELAAAVRLQEQGGPTLDELQARILAQQSDDEIASAMGFPSGVVFWNERLHFNVRDRLSACDWILSRIVHWNRPISGRDVGIGLKLFAYHGGRHVLEIVLAVVRDEPLPAWAIPGTLTNRASAESRLRASCRLALDAYLQPSQMLAELCSLGAELERSGQPSSGPRKDSILQLMGDHWRNSLRRKGPKKQEDNAPRGLEELTEKEAEQWVRNIIFQTAATFAGSAF